MESSEKNSIHFTIYTHTTHTHPRQTKNLNTHWNDKSISEKCRVFFLILTVKQISNYGIKPSEDTKEDW